MGASLFHYCTSFRRTIEDLDCCLRGIEEAPTWSLIEELLRIDDPMRIQCTDVSQPLCTALQIALVDLLKECGIEFKAVVGHSSGEIAAAYAAGIIDAKDAVLVAFYRGFHSRRAQVLLQRSGKMMAVGMTPEQAAEFCQQSHFSGQICVAARNSATSVTLSGDSTAIDDAKVALDKKSVFARVLKVDTAYHSPHMKPIREPYLQSLKNAEIRPRRASFRGACNWYSSVLDEDDDWKRTPLSFADTYWVENMTRPVSFSRAVTSAVEQEHVDFVLEVGPHSALQGPVTETINGILGKSLPYRATLERNKDALCTFSGVLGFVWTLLDTPDPAVDFARFRKSCEGGRWTLPSICKGLEPYPWDHDRSMLKESKRSRAWRTRETAVQELLGHPVYTSNDREVRWRNILRLGDVEWMSGHKFQGQVLVPAAVYLAMAVNATLHLVGSTHEIRMVELQDFVIHHGITMDETSAGIDIDFVIRLGDESSMHKTATLSCYCSNADARSPQFQKKTFTGSVLVHLGASAADALPSRVAPGLPLTDVSTDRFYTWLQKVGLQYSEPFVLKSIKRRLNLARVSAVCDLTDGYLVHPAALDSMLQSFYAGFSYPGDERMWTAFLPKSFGRVRFSMGSCPNPDGCAGSQYSADCYLTSSSAREFGGDMDIFCTLDGHAKVQAQGVVFTSLEVPAATNDRDMFWKTTWKRDILSADELAEGSCITVSSATRRLHGLCEQAAYFYLNEVCRDIKPHEISSLGDSSQAFMHWALACIYPTAQPDQRSRQDPGWHYGDINSAARPEDGCANGSIDLEILDQLGPKLPALVRGSTTLAQTLDEDGMLARLYAEGLGVPETRMQFADILGRISHQHPQTSIIEIGACTGELTTVALKCLGSKFENYTLTNVSPTPSRTAEVCLSHSERPVSYQAFDIDKSPVKQGFQAHSYDIVIASRLLYGTKSVAQAVRHCRELLRPGGFLILIELASLTSLRLPLIQFASPGWRRGNDDGCTRGPAALSEAQWDALMRDSGFCGVDRAFRDFEDDSVHSVSVILAQAVDGHISALRDPLASVGHAVRIERLLIVGGRTLEVSRLAGRVKRLLDPFADETTVVSDLDDLAKNDLKYGSVVVWLSGLEEAALKRISKLRLTAMQSLFRNAKYVLCATKGSLSDDPYAGLTVGIARTVSRELTHLQLRLVDVRQLSHSKHLPEATTFSKILLQMIYLDISRPDNIMWANETELAMEDGDVLIPRVVLDDELNRRFNATRRTITESVDPISTPVMIHREGEELVIRRSQHSSWEDVRNSSSLVQVLSSSLFRFACLDGTRPWYMNFGYLSDSKHTVLAISESSVSAIAVDADDAFELATGADSNTILAAILAVLICENILSGSTGTIWVHNADACTEEIIRHLREYADVPPLFFTTSKSVRTLLGHEEPCYIHPQISERQLKLLLPWGIGRFVDMGRDTTSLSEVAVAVLGQGVDIQRPLLRAKTLETVPLQYGKTRLLNILNYYSSRPDLLVRLGGLASSDIVKADSTHVLSPPLAGTTIISWADVRSVQARVLPAVKSKLFSGEKTYFLIGLTGDLGLSICSWMVEHGAKYFALASRSPSVPPEILAELWRMGATVRVFSLDVADMGSLTAVYEEVVASMPPIAGVANGALVVRDHPFDTMTVEDLELVFRPKVVGSQNLDRLFFSVPLDFFILFSSITSVVGKSAQSSYTAANLFMSALAVGRRKRGLAASVIAFGMLLGVGFIHEKAESRVEARFRQDGFAATSEPEFHAVFAQAVSSGRPDSGLDPVVISGLNNEADAPWRTIPRFSHCNKHAISRRGDTPAHNQAPTNRDIGALLGKASDVQQAMSLLEVAVASRVSLALGSADGTIDNHVGLVSLGLDSLAAVEIRSWLLKVLDVDLPVLKLLSGFTLRDISQYVLDQLPIASRPWDKVDGSIGMNGDDCNPNLIIQENKYITMAALDGSESGSKNVEYARRKVVGPEDPSGTRCQTQLYDATSRPAEYERVGDMMDSQKQIYFLHEYSQNNAYNVAYYGHFQGPLDIARLQEALRAVGEQHEALRSAYIVSKSSSRVVQAVMSRPHIILEHRQAHDDAEAKSVIDAVKDFRFELDKGIVMKVTVISYSASYHFLLFNHHHIALDGFSWGVFLVGLSRAYNGDTHRGRTFPRGQQSIDMAMRKQGALVLQELHTHLSFWRGVYGTVPDPLPLFSFSKVRTRPTVKRYIVDTATTKLQGNLVNLIGKAASKIGVTLFHFYLASLSTFLARCLRVKDVVIGVVDANRTQAQDQETIGYFLNMLPVRIQLEQSEQFDLIAKRSRDMALAALAARAPLDAVLDDLGVSRATSHHPLFQVAINYMSGTLHETNFGCDGKIQWDGAVLGGHPYDLLLNIVATPEWTSISWATNHDLYEGFDGELLLKWYIRALESLAQDTGSEIGKCSISNNTDIVEASKLGQGTVLSVEWNGLPDRVHEIVAEQPDGIAIVDDQGQTFTYAQMAAKSNQVISQIQAVVPSLGPGAHVAMLLDPVADAVCCILAILRLGLVWVPLDTRNHLGRLRAVVRESRPPFLMCHDATATMAGQICADMVTTSLLNIDASDAQDAVHKGFLGHDVVGHILYAPEQPAMILYTSGSTGVPKGVILTHKGLVNQIYGTICQFQLEHEITLQQSPLGFDLMLDQIFLALCTGGTVVMVGKAGRGDPVHMAELMVRNGVTLTHFVPSEYHALLNYGHHILTKCSSWRHAMSGGEKLGTELYRGFCRLECDGLKLVNVYGPAEITLACARGVAPYREPGDLHGASSDYLLPSPNYRLEICDEYMNILPVGFSGEICILGDGVGLGYLDRPEESGLKFTHRDTSSSSPALRVYRSGDKGRLLPDGSLKVMGRLDGDSQVKIHGFRVELDDIANVIMNVADGKVANAAASFRATQASGILVAFVEFNILFAGVESDFLDWLRANLPLPSIMTPQLIVPIERMPVTTNGKLDRTAVDTLPLPISNDMGVIEADVPADALSSWEQSIMEVWEETLLGRAVHDSGQSREPIPIQSSSDFFQIGGNSILMIKLQSLLQVQLGVKIPMPELFHASTLTSMAALVKSHDDTSPTNGSLPRTKPFLSSGTTRQGTNWDLEIASLVDALPQPGDVPSGFRHQAMNESGGLIVVMTGATGFIGRHLLSRLVRDPGVAEVHCIATRPDKNGNPRRLSSDSSKVIVYTGDLSDISLGLSRTQSDLLAARAHVIIHNGADVSLLKTYRSLRRANVVATRTLCAMAIPRRVPLHYVSTASVAKAMALEADEALGEVAASPGVPALLDAIDGYAATKWTSEMLLGKTAAQCGLPVFVHRLAHVLGDDASELDATGMLTKYSFALGALPRLRHENVAGAWDFVYVADVARDLVASAMESAAASSRNGSSSSALGKQAATDFDRPRFLNHCADVKVPHGELRDHLEGVGGKPLEHIELKAWLQVARERGLHPLVHEFFTAFDEGKGVLALPLIKKGAISGHVSGNGGPEMTGTFYPR